jgi:hypothetical protein
MPVGAAGTRSHATLIAEAGGKAWIYGPVNHTPNGDKIQVAETWDGSIIVRHFGIGPSTLADASVTTNADLAANEYETGAILLGRRT